MGKVVFVRAMTHDADPLARRPDRRDALAIVVVSVCLLLAGIPAALGRNAVDPDAVGDLAAAEPKTLAERWGAYGLRLSQLAHAQDARLVDPEQSRKTISAETTFNDDLADIDALEDKLWPLCEKVTRQARSAGIAGRVASLKLRAADFRLITRRRTLAVPTQSSRALFAVARELLAAEARGGRYRLIGAGLSDFVDAADGLDLFAEEERRDRRSEKALDALRERFGRDAVMTGRALRSRD